MKRKTTWLLWITLALCQAILISLAKANPNWIQTYYTQGFYLHLSNAFRVTLGWIPFSVGDLLYGLVIGFLLYKLYSYFNKRNSMIGFAGQLVGLIVKTSLVFYMLFHLLWGYNNYKLPIEQTLKMQTQYTQDELLYLTDALLVKATELHKQSLTNSLDPVVIPYGRLKIRTDAQDAVQHIAPRIGIPEFTNRSIKNSLWSLPLTYMGFSGYINPFTNEAQVNHMVPKISMVLTAMHETAHQTGIAKESEANLVAYLAASNHKDTLYQYAATIYALRYCLNTLERSNYAGLDALLQEIPQGIVINLKESQEFWQQYKGLSSAFFKMFYGNFLKTTNQKQGIYSYNRFVDLLINYHKTVPL